MRPEEKYKLFITVPGKESLSPPTTLAGLMNAATVTHIGGPKNNEDVIFLRWTTLLDRDDNEIYDGDVIELDREWAKMIDATRIRCLVGFKDGCAMFGRSKDPRWLDSYLWMSAKRCKVVGSSYEKPELLG